jgi:hypothetical protein
MTVSKEYDFIERVKLTALGVSKAFVHGEVTYSSAEKGLQIFLERLKGMRSFFENVWWYPRFFGVMAQKNNWIKPTQAELSHKVRTKRSKLELFNDRRYIVPSLVWAKSLDSQSNIEKVRVLMDLKARLGINVSRTDTLAAMGLNWEEQENKYREEDKIAAEIAKEHGVTPVQKKPEGGAAGFGMPGGEELPGVGTITPPAEMGGETAPGETAPVTGTPAAAPGGPTK